MLICRACQQPADSSRRDYGNTYVTFFYVHSRPEDAELIHTWNVESDLARQYVEEDAERTKLTIYVARAKKHSKS